MGWVGPCEWGGTGRAAAAHEGADCMYRCVPWPQKHVTNFWISSMDIGAAKMKQGRQCRPRAACSSRRPATNRFYYNPVTGHTTWNHGNVKWPPFLLNIARPAISCRCPSALRRPGRLRVCPASNFHRCRARWPLSH